MYKKKIINHVNTNSEFAISNIDFSTVNKNPSTLFIELTTISMFCQNKLIILANGEKSISQELKHVLSNNIGNNYIIITSGELSPDSTLRQYYDNSRNAASIGCYKDDNDNLSFIISDFLTKNKVQYNATTLQYLHNVLSQNCNALQPELEKLILYIGNNKNLTIQNIQESLLTEIDPISEDLCVSVAEKNLENFTKFSDVLLKNKFTPIALIRILIKYFSRLEYLIRTIKNGEPINQAIKSIHPPIFFKSIPTIKKHVSAIPYAEINNIIKKLVEIEIQCKKSDSNQEVIFKYYLTTMITRK
ncbi:DNA polymerase III, delta subunit [Ehrlichia chaffeensis str. Heartland]|nr:DNA polymerase III subunit delta [Ehrlichia chaffeensis]AHX04078.1 DNA polymerase III, delta subunit [Ehrlichia chaffeensis str. Heartland]AHX06011.1 DNA polymerase III, delta subunit [Ehrlichia chaffeensis str. Jax]AHX07001.1 DNA polymerase III, delta subunit [Ehrlichia chaffeensis str. Liberty]AHX07493.1 DNA polymerase III, delta subunit [Ehrlichia chaffeensis str. Osceola]AHX08406.1 DNA polymerase III, delta subunit [Ehrlichia chaffeensis str. Saint Vincent]AHX09239.1 DNA polymerase III